MVYLAVGRRMRALMESNTHWGWTYSRPSCVWPTEGRSTTWWVMQGSDSA